MYRRILLALAVAVATTIGLSTPAQASHTYATTCNIFTDPVPTEYQNATKDGSYVSAGGNVFCHEAAQTAGFATQVTELYINVTLQIQSTSGIWFSRDTGSARWTGLIGNSPPTVRAYASDVCVTPANRKHRLRYNEVWWRDGNGAIHEIISGSVYSGSQPYLTCGT